MFLGKQHGSIGVRKFLNWISTFFFKWEGVFTVLCWNIIVLVRIIVKYFLVRAWGLWGLSFVFINPGKSVLLTFIMVTLYCIFFFTLFQGTDASFRQVIERILTSIVLPWSQNDSSYGRVKGYGKVKICCTVWKYVGKSVSKLQIQVATYVF